jgi:hypothetical protein
MRKFGLLATLICVSACGKHTEPGKPAGSIDVSVLTDGQQCVVRRERMPCDDVGRYLHETLLVEQDRSIGVLVVGVERAHERGTRVRKLIGEAGYARIAVVGFESEPPGRGTPPP